MHKLQKKQKLAAIAKSPLEILIVRNEQDREGLTYEEAAERAFKGSSDGTGYLATGEDLGVELRKFHSSPQVPASALLDATCHTLVITILGEHGMKDSIFLSWLDECWKLIRSSKGRHLLILLTLQESIADALRKLPLLKNAGALTCQELGERAIRAGRFSLLVLHQARVVLAEALSLGKKNGQHGCLTLFISHAKLDGLPLAQALQHQIDDIPWLKSFYDACDLQGIADFERRLHQAVMSSLLIILRTDAYEQRAWCRQEALWAEEHATPTILVEARPGLFYPPGELPLERMPSVRIPDGNLFRILHAALREGLRYLLFQRRVTEMLDVGIISKDTLLQVFSYPPSMAALLRACNELNAKRKSSKKPAMILYPDPPLRSGISEAANALVASIAPYIQLATPQTLAVETSP